jgi:CubicO group peptidase (beta-lactamase class C family)
MVARAHVAGVGYAAVTRGREVVVGGSGLADVAQRRGVGADTVFEAASIAKLVVATCVMQLVEEGKVDLDADASKYVGFALRHPRAATPITMRMLLSHRASIRDRQDEIGAAREGQPLLAFLGRMMLEDGKPRAAAFWEAAPGTATSYSNVGASLAALAVERIAGASFADVSARRIFEPLRMRTASWTAPMLGATDTYARPYAFRDAGFVALPSPSHALYPAVDLHASARDLARFARAMLRGGELDGARILTGATVDTMMTAVTGDPQQGLAWQLRSMGGAHVVGHEGEDAGATTALFLDRAANSGAVVLANGDAFGSDDPSRAAAVQTFLGELLTLARTTH